jgi:hypothetical protein
MVKYVLSLTFAVSLASAATISTSATCDGVTTVGMFFASCNDGRYMAYASLSAPSFVDTQIGLSDFSVSVDVNQVGLGPPGAGSATASFGDDYVFTMYGGTGNGSYCPGILTAHGSGGSAGMFFAGIRTEDCFISGRVPFTFGMPQIVSIGMVAQTSGVGALSGGGSASLLSVAFFDPAGNPLSNATFTLVEVPEPSAASLLSIGLMFFLAVRIRRMRFRRCFHRCDLL